jgi:hypothetical protein
MGIYNFTYKKYFESGQIIIFVLIILSGSILISLATFNVVAPSVFFAGYESDRERAFQMAEAGLNRAIFELNRNSSWNGISETPLGEGSYEVSITTISSNEKEIISTGYYPNKSSPKSKLSIRARASTGVLNPSFHYGAQVGEGGIEFENNATIVGSVYSDGNIIGAPGASITGDVWVAGGTLPEPDQQWSIYNSDYEFGKNVGGERRFDVAQSFVPATSTVINKVSIYLKKTGSPSDIIIRIHKDQNGSPGNRSSDVIASQTLSANSVTSSYGWIDISFISPPQVIAGTRYWLVIDAGEDNLNYWVWGSDVPGGYTSGQGKYSENWSTKPWFDAGRDFNFKIWMGGVITKIQEVSVGGSVHANTIQKVTASGGAYGKVIDGGTYTGIVKVYSMSNCRVNGDAYYSINNGCSVSGSRISPYDGEPDPAPIPLPLSESNIAQFKMDAQSGGVCGPPECDSNGNFQPTPRSTVYIGPKKISGNMVLGNNQNVILTGTLWVAGYVDISNGASIKCSPNYGSNSCVLISDGWIHIENNGEFRGSGEAGSYIMLLTTASGGTHHGAAIDLHNNATGAIFYAANGMIWLHNNVTVSELVGYKIHLSQNAILSYEQGLQSASFSIGPQGSWGIKRGSFQIIK